MRLTKVISRLPIQLKLNP